MQSENITDDIEIENKRILKKVIETKFTTQNQVLDYFYNPISINYYLKSIQADNIKFNKEIYKNKIDLPLVVNYDIIPKLNFFPYTLPKTKVTQKYYKENNAFITDIETKYLYVKTSVLPFIEKEIKFLIVIEILKKKKVISCKILDKIIKDYIDIYNIISEYIISK